MKTYKYKIVDTAGQITAVIVENIKTNELAEFSTNLMNQNKTIEQVGALQGTQFTMMGGELSINGLIAGASLLGKSGKINELEFLNEKGSISISFPKSLVKKFDRTTNTVYLQGIAYRVLTTLPKNKTISAKTKNMLKALAKTTPASGAIYCIGNRITPLVFVKATNSYVWENACGSGSLAASLVSRSSTIMQPSGASIRFKYTTNSIIVTTTVREV